MTSHMCATFCTRPPSATGRGSFYKNLSAGMLLLALLAVSVGCGGLTPPRTFDEAVNNPTLTLDGMKAAIEDAGLKDKWKMKDLGPGRMQGALSVRAHTIVVDIFYTPHDFKITYRDSVNMMYDGTTIHPNYNVWVKKLADNIKAVAIAR